MNKSTRDDMPRINDEIDAEQLRLIDEESNNQGVVAFDKALAMAEEAGLDLVEISPQAKPPVAKIMDFGKFKYEKQKKRQEVKRKQKTIGVKEVKIRPNIEAHDYQVKLAAAHKFVAAGDKVKLTLRFRGRELSHREIGEAVVERFVADMADIAKPESDIRMEERQIIVVFVAIGS